MPPKNDTPEPPLIPKEVAPLVGRSERWVQRACAAGKIRTCPIGKPYQIPPSEVRRLQAIDRE